MSSNQISKIIRLIHIELILTIYVSQSMPEKLHNNVTNKIDPKCPFSKIIEDIFKIHNKTTDKGIFLEDNTKATELIQNITNGDKTKNKTLSNEQVNKIIESINKIKSNLTINKANLFEAIVLSIPPKENKTKLNMKKDINKLTINKPLNQEEPKGNVTGNATYVEILTIEPNNTNKQNNTGFNIIDLLKTIVPMFNGSLTKEIRNFTIIERVNSQNNSHPTVKNISTVIVTYCDDSNMTKINDTINMDEETMITNPKTNSNKEESEFRTEIDKFTKLDLEEKKFLEAPKIDISVTNKNDGKEPAEIINKEDELTPEEKRDIIEAADYGMQKMHELYTVMEPKLYSLGLWLDDTEPARYVAAFNAPAEDAAVYAKYGYASLQAALKLKELTGGDNKDGLESRQDETFPNVSLMKQSSLIQHCPIRGSPKCPPASKIYRTHDGTCNNFKRLKWGSTMTPVQRFLPPSYSDGIQAPRRSVHGPKLPSAREISSIIHEDRNVETASITHLLMQWGQFIDHDITSSSQTRGFNGSVPRCCRNGGKDFVPKELLHPECMPIEVPSSDPFYSPRGIKCLDFIRSSPAPRDDCSLGWREQLNQVSAYLDASPVYGSSAKKSDSLRLFRNGMLQYGKVQQRKPVLPPEKKDELCRGGAVSSECFKSGDARVNEHPGLVAAHIIWLRQHNRMAQELSNLNPQWSDEKIYQETRKIVGAMIQHITYNEFLPVVLGSEVMRLFGLELLKRGFYNGYDIKTNPSPASSFGSAAFRFGHSLVQPSMMRYDRFHRPIHNNVTLHREPSNPSNIWSIGAVDRLILGMVNQPIQKRDEFITEELTNRLFQSSRSDFGTDLAAINIQRGRDHGLPGYTAWREPCGLTALTDFDSLLRVMPARTVHKLQSIYRHVDDIDLFTGGMAERQVVGGLVGPTFACIIAQQFSNLRNGDRFWYENGGFESSFTPAQLQQIRRVTFAQVLCRTLDTIDSTQPFVFLSPDNDGNGRISCQTRLLNNFDMSPWTEIDENFKNDLTALDTTKTKTTEHDNVTPTLTTKPNIFLTSFNKVTKRHPIPLVDHSELETALNIETHADNHKNKLKLTDIIKHIHNTKLFSKIEKLDTKNKNRRFAVSDIDDINRDNTDSKTRQDYYDDDDSSDVQSVQSVVINNLAHKRPTQKPSYHRPVISVTENIDKFTYLINYVPRQTQSWRQTTKRPDRDIVKITYQNYDDTYRRPYKPYKYYQNHNREDDNPIDIQLKYRRDIPDTPSSHRGITSPTRPNTHDRTLPTLHNTETTTENSHKLITFGYVGTYKRNDFTNDTTDNDSELLNTALSKDFSTNYQTRQNRPNDMKLSTFYLTESTTKPYNIASKVTRRRDDNIGYDKHSDRPIDRVKDLSYNYPNKMTQGPLIVYEEDMTINNYNNAKLEDRSDALPLFQGSSLKSAKPIRNKAPLKKPGLASAAKTPSVAFQIIPSENSPSLWAVYDEDSSLSDGFPEQMPVVDIDPLASKEIPKPLKISMKRRPGHH